MLQGISKLPINKNSADDIIQYINGDSARFKQLMDLFLNGNVRVSQLTSWAVGHIAEKHQSLIEPYHNQLLEKLADSSVHNSVRRNIVRIYQTATIPEEIEGIFYDYCLKAINNPKEAIAIRVFSMTVCERIAKKYIDLIPELIESLSAQLHEGSAGFKNRGAKTIKNLTKKNL